MLTIGNPDTHQTGRTPTSAQPHPVDETEFTSRYRANGTSLRWAAFRSSINDWAVEHLLTSDAPLGYLATPTRVRTIDRFTIATLGDRLTDDLDFSAVKSAAFTYDLTVGSGTFTGRSFAPIAFFAPHGVRGALARRFSLWATVQMLRDVTELPLAQLDLVAAAAISDALLPVVSPKGEPVSRDARKMAWSDMVGSVKAAGAWDLSAPALATLTALLRARPGQNLAELVAVAAAAHG